MLQNGLPPEDTTWEDWEDLKAAYHLEDKVFLHGQGDDSAKEPSPTYGPNTAGSNRPKSNDNRPAGWDRLYSLRMPLEYFSVRIK